MVTKVIYRQTDRDRELFLLSDSFFEKHSENLLDFRVPVTCFSVSIHREKYVTLLTQRSLRSTEEGNLLLAISILYMDKTIRQQILVDNVTNIF